MSDPGGGRGGSAQGGVPGPGGRGGGAHDGARGSAVSRADGAVRVVRRVLVVVGVLVLAFGASTLMQTAKTENILGLLRWLVGAVVLHDAILSPFVVLVGLGLRRAGRVLRPWVLVVLQSAVVVGAVLVATVLPEIGAAHHAKNPTVVPFDYTLRLVLVEAALAVVVVVALFLGRRRRLRRG